MKLHDALLDTPMTGECKIDPNIIVKRFGMSIVSRWHDKYTFCNQRAGIKVQIPKQDALDIIKRAGLVEVPTLIFRHGSTFMKPERAQKCYPNLIKLADDIINGRAEELPCMK